MKQAIMTEPGKIEFREVARPEPGSDAVLMQTRHIGVCGSDIHVYHGKHPYTSYPVVQGHEVAGIVAEVGSNVKEIAVGDPVTLMPQVTCGVCYPCRHGMYHICESLKVMGFQTGGAAQEFFVVPAANVIRLPDTLPLDHGAMIEPVSVAVHAVSKSPSVEDRQVLVLGAGTIGNLTAQVAKASGAKAVMITDISEYKLQKARACGIDFTVNTASEDLNEAILRHFGPDRADLIFECVGSQTTASQAINMARKGSTIVIVGVFGKKPEVDLGLVQDRELCLVGSLMYQKPDYERAVSLAEEGKIHLPELVTHRFRFADYLDAYHEVERSRGQYMKIMIDVD